MKRETYIVTFHRVGPHEYKETSRNAAGSITDALGILEEQYGDEWLDRHVPILVASPEDGSIAWVSDSVGKGLAYDDQASDATFFANPREGHADMSLFDIRNLTLDMAMRCTPPSDTMEPQFQAERLVIRAKVFEDYLLGIVNEKTDTKRPARQHSGGQRVEPLPMTVRHDGQPLIPFEVIPDPEVDPGRSRSAQYGKTTLKPEPGEPSDS